MIAWIDAQPLETLFLSAITVVELRAGVALLPEDKRRAGLHNRLETRVLPLFAGRVLPFDLGCSPAYAELMAKGRAADLVIACADAYIAAIAAANGLAGATRDTAPYPWPGGPGVSQAQTVLRTV